MPENEGGDQRPFESDEEDADSTVNLLRSLEDSAEVENSEKQ